MTGVNRLMVIGLGAVLLVLAIAVSAIVAANYGVDFSLPVRGLAQ